MALTTWTVSDSGQMRVIQGGGSLRLAPKAGERQRITGQFFGEKLESDEAMQASV